MTLPASLARLRKSARNTLIFSMDPSVADAMAEVCEAAQAQYAALNHCLGMVGRNQFFPIEAANKAEGALTSTHAALHSALSRLEAVMGGTP